MSTFTDIYGSNYGSVLSGYNPNTNYLQNYGVNSAYPQAQVPNYNNTSLFGNSNVMFPNAGQQYTQPAQSNDPNNMLMTLFAVIISALLGKNGLQTGSSDATTKSLIDSLSSNTGNDQSVGLAALKNVLSNPNNGNNVLVTSDNFNIAQNQYIDNLFILEDKNFNIRNVTNSGKVGNVYVLDKDALAQSGLLPGLFQSASLPQGAISLNQNQPLYQSPFAQVQQPQVQQPLYNSGLYQYPWAQNQLPLAVDQTEVSVTPKYF